MKNTDSCGKNVDKVVLAQMHRFSTEVILREKIEDGSFGLVTAETLRDVGPNLHFFLLGDAFALMSCMVKPYSRRQKWCMCLMRTTGIL